MWNLSTCAFAVLVVLSAACINGGFDSASLSKRHSTDVVDARSYRHCHNTPRRTYCHTREPLPITTTPLPILCILENSGAIV
jgi:hypothetical protein